MSTNCALALIGVAAFFAFMALFFVIWISGKKL